VTADTTATRVVCPHISTGCRSTQQCTSEHTLTQQGLRCALYTKNFLSCLYPLFNNIIYLIYTCLGLYFCTPLKMLIGWDLLQKIVWFSTCSDYAIRVSLMMACI